MTGTARPAPARTRARPRSGSPGRSGGAGPASVQRPGAKARPDPFPGDLADAAAARDGFCVNRRRRRQRNVGPDRSLDIPLLPSSMDVMDRASRSEAARAKRAAGATVAARRRRRPRPGVAGATVALLTAVFVWMVVALLVARGEIASALPGGVSAFVALTVASCLVDLGAAWLVVRDRARVPILGYLVVRAVLAASGVVFLAFPSDALAAAALFASPRPRGASARPHAFEPADLTPAPAITLSASLFASDWSRMSRPADAGRRCAACGEAEGDADPSSRRRGLTAARGDPPSTRRHAGLPYRRSRVS